MLTDKYSKYSSYLRTLPSIDPVKIFRLDKIRYNFFKEVFEPEVRENAATVGALPECGY